MFHVPEFPENMPAEWYSHWGFLNDYEDKAVVLGEWGGKNNGLDAPWQKKFTNWLLEECLSDNFYWDLNPESGDTGGLLKGDWFTPETEKIELTNKVQPYPSRLNYNAIKKELCLDPGRYANNDCLERRKRKERAAKSKSIKRRNLIEEKQLENNNEVTSDEKIITTSVSVVKKPAKSLNGEEPMQGEKEDDPVEPKEVYNDDGFDVVIVRDKARNNI